jgi:hypothetical protein
MPHQAELTFFLCRESDDMTTLLASKGQQLWMRPMLGVSAVQFHRSPAQFAAGWCKAWFRGSSHFLSLDLGFLIGHCGVERAGISGPQSSARHALERECI